MDETQHILKTFLDQNEQKVLMLKGAWGTGKTYFWKQFVSAHYDGAYSYVSLFGLETLQEIKAKVLLSRTKEPDANSTGQLQRWMERSVTLAKGIKGIGTFVDPLADAVQEILIKDQLVCLDDLERRHKNLSLSQVLGFVSNLTAEKGCRVVLIVNEDNLLRDDNDKNDLDRYREKVIDRETTFAPGVRRNASIAFPDNPELASFVADIFQHLDINNIRVMKQCKWCMDLLEPLIRHCESAVRNEVRMHVAILTAARYESDFGLSMDDLARYNNFSAMFHLFSKEKGEEDPKLKKATWLSNEFGFNWQDYDRLLAKYFNQGYFDANAFAEYVKALDLREKINHTRQRLIDTYGFYNSNFQSDAAEIEAQCISFLNENARVMSLKEISNMVDFLKSIGRHQGDRVAEWIDQSITGMLDHLDFCHLVEMQPHATSADLRQQIEEHIAEYKKTALNPMAVIRHMVEKSGWSPYHIDALKAYSDADFEEWLRNERDSDLLKYLQDVLRTFKQNTDKDHQFIYDNLKKALLRIANDNDVNKARVRDILNVDVSEKTEEATQ